MLFINELYRMNKYLKILNEIKRIGVFKKKKINSLIIV